MQRFVLRATILLLAAVWANSLMVKAAFPAGGSDAELIPLSNVHRVGSRVVKHGFGAPLEFENDQGGCAGAAALLPD